MPDVLFIVMPAYNEEASLPRVLDQWYPFVEADNDNRLIVVNDGSTDNTEKVLREYAMSHPQLLPISKDNGGHGAAIYHAYKFALAPHETLCKPDFVFQTDSDGQTDPKDFERFWEARHEYDAILGHRKGRQDGSSRVFVTNVLKLVVRAALKTSSSDANAPFRLMTYDALQRGMRFVPKDFNLTNIALCASLQRQNLKVKYLPISFGKRTTGVNSINFKKIIPIGIRALRDFRDINKNIASKSSDPEVKDRQSDEA